MALADRDPRSSHHFGGIDPADYHDFAPGQRVMTREGFAGVVTDVQDGPIGGSEHYAVTLDDGMGGGDYSASDLTAMVLPSLAATSALSELHEASDDYPELFEVLRNRLPPENQVEASKRADWMVVDDKGATHSGPHDNVYDARNAITDEGLDPDALNVVKEPTFDGTTMMETTATEHQDVWRGALAKLAEGLDFNDSDDRAIFRGRVEQSFRQATLDAINQVAEGYGKGRSASRAQAVRTVADALITEHTASRQPTAGRILDWYADKTHYEPGRNFSVDWCRFRRDQHCWFPKLLDVPHTRKAGYAVWIPEDRGYCPRNKWDDQRDCRVAEPGPKSGDPDASPEATLSWEEGGQRVSIRSGGSILDDIREDLSDWGKHQQCVVCGRPATWRAGTDNLCVRHLNRTHGRPLMKIEGGLDGDDEFGFHFQATWADVRSKAKRIRAEGHVRVLSATAGYVTAEIRGDTNIYQTTIMRVPGGKSTAMWECGCAWANYSWGRSGRWKRYEGRMCAHALALTYEAQAREMFGKEITEDRSLPQWRSDPTLPVVRPGDARTKPQPWRVGAKEDPFDYGDIVMLGWSPMVEPYLDPMMKKLVDYKSDRPLSGLTGGDLDDIMVLKAVLPGISWTPYSRMPFFDTLHDLMGSEPTKDAVTDLVEDRDSLFGKLPTRSVTVDPHTTVFTQPTVNGVKVRQMIATGITAGGPPAFIVHFRGKDYIIDGHHRLVAQMIKGIHSINAKVLNLDDPAVERRIIHGSLTVEALPMLKADPSFEELTAWYDRAAHAEEPRVSRDMTQIANEEGGMTAGFAYRFKSPKSIRNKLDRKAPAIRSGQTPPSNWIKDALRYTIVFHPAVYSAKVQDCLYRLEEKGYKVTEEENSWMPGDSYSSLAYNLIEPGGLVIELQFATAESFILKQKTLHSLYEEFREGSTPLRRKQELWDIMTKYWNDVEIPKDVLGFPERGIEGFPKPKPYNRPIGLLVRGRGYNPHLVETGSDLALAPATAMRKQTFLMALVRGVVQRIKAIVGDDAVRLDNGTVVPVTDVVHPRYDPHIGIIDFHPRLAGVRDRPSSSYGMVYDPALLHHPEVEAAKEFTGWSTLPLTTVDPHGLWATEDLLQSATIDRLTANPAIRPGYYPFVARLSDGREVVIDGHHRVAVTTALDLSGFQAHVLDMRTHKASAYFWKDTHTELSVEDMEQIAREHGVTDEELTAMKAAKQKAYSNWLRDTTRSWVYEMWGHPGAPLTMWTGEGIPPWLRDEELTTAAKVATDTTTAPDYAIAQSHGGQYTHVVREGAINGTTLALCGTTVVPRSMKNANYMDALGQATCGRCLTIMRAKTASIDTTDSYDIAEMALLFEADAHDEATLHDEPEPALPETDGEVVTDVTDDERDDPEPVGPISPQGATTPTGPAWLAPSGSSGSDRFRAHQAANVELATMARAFLKDGSKVFTPEEQQAIINEDTGERAANLDRLNIEGTHYQRLEALDADDDESWLA